MNDRNDKGPVASRLSLGKTERTATPRTRTTAAPVVVDPSAQAWKSYCASRLRHFASGR